MRYSDPTLLQAFHTTALTSQQSSLLQQILRSLDADTHVSQHVATAPSALVSLIRAHAALAGHSIEGQPRHNLLGRVIRTALASINAAMPAYRLAGHVDLTNAQSLLVNIAGVISQQRDQTPRGSTNQCAQQLELLLTSLSEAVKSWMTPLWNGVESDASLVEYMTAEVAVLVALEGRDESELRTELLRLLIDGSPTAEAVKALLWPPATHHRVTLAVHGARELRGLEQFLPGSRQWKMWSGQTADQLPENGTIRSFAVSLGPLDGSAVLVSMPVAAADPRTAVEAARRELSEALDHYAANERLLELSLAPQWLVAPPTRVPKRGSVRVPAKRVAYPLTQYIPESLRPAMRAASLARQVDAPMTSAALCWSALESTGLSAQNVEQLARACALQTLRQRLTSLHAVLISSTKARLAHQRWRIEEERGQLRRHENAVSACAQSDSPLARAAYRDHTNRAEQASHRLVAEIQALECIEAAIASNLKALADQTPTEEPYGRLLSVDTWLEVLLPAHATSSPTLCNAQAAVNILAAHAGGLAAEALTVWQSRLADPLALAEWLQRQAEMYGAILEWLYVTRNLAFHRGHFTAPSDALTALAGRGIVDMALEFVGNWRTVELSRGVPESPVADVYRRLSDRMVALDAKLRTPGMSCHPLRVTHLSGPDESWWSQAVSTTSSGSP